MAKMRKIVVEVPEDMAQRIDAQVQHAGYADATALVVDSLEVYLDQSRFDGSDAVVEQWLRDDVLPTIERRDREKTQDIPEDQVTAILTERRNARTSVA